VTLKVFLQPRQRFLNLPAVVSFSFLFNRFQGLRPLKGLRSVEGFLRTRERLQTLPAVVASAPLSHHGFVDEFFNRFQGLRPLKG
jgi:hypothetical protein